MPAKTTSQNVAPVVDGELVDRLLKQWVEDGPQTREARRAHADGPALTLTFFGKSVTISSYRPSNAAMIADTRARVRLAVAQSDAVEGNAT